MQEVKQTLCEYIVQGYNEDKRTPTPRCISAVGVQILEVLLPELEGHVLVICLLRCGFDLPRGF
jgi:hypothetical protein